MKSREEFLRKARFKREKGRYTGLDYFAYHDRNEVFDPVLARYLPELERSLQITEDVLRYLVTRAVKPVKARRDAAAADGAEEESESDLPSAEDEEEAPTGERIDESESEAAPAAID